MNKVGVRVNNLNLHRDLDENGQRENRQQNFGINGNNQFGAFRGRGHRIG